MGVEYSIWYRLGCCHSVSSTHRHSQTLLPCEYSLIRTRHKRTKVYFGGTMFTSMVGVEPITAGWEDLDTYGRRIRGSVRRTRQQTPDSARRGIEQSDGECSTHGQATRTLTDSDVLYWPSMSIMQDSRPSNRAPLMCLKHAPLCWPDTSPTGDTSDSAARKIPKKV